MNMIIRSAKQLKKLNIIRDIVAMNEQQRAIIQGKWPNTIINLSRNPYEGK